MPDGGGPQEVRPRLPKPVHALVVGFGYLALVWLLFLAFDLGNLFGTRDWLAARWDFPVLWYHLFRGGSSPTELVQWTFLGTLVVCAGLAAGVFVRNGAQHASRFWLLMAVAGALMLMVDTGLRPDSLNRMVGAWVPPIARHTFRLGVFGLIVMVAAAAILLYGRRLHWPRSTLRLLVVGLLFYGIAVVATATRGIGTLHTSIGGFIDHVLLGGSLLRISDYHHWYRLDEITGYMLVDYLLTETFQLIGAVLLLGACLSYYRDWTAYEPGRGGQEEAAGALPGQDGSGARRAVAPPARSGPWLPRPRHALMVGFGYLAVTWTIFFAVEVGNLLGTRDWLAARVGFPVIWHRLGFEGGLHEVLTYSFLAAFAVCAAVAAGVLMREGTLRPAHFWLLMAVAGVFMLIEDAGNPRHYLAAIAAGQFGETGRDVTEFIVFSLIAAVPISAVLLYGRSILRCRSTVALLAGAFLFYGTAGFTSGVRNVGTWYVDVGTYIDQVILRGALLEVADYDLPSTTGHALMALWFEETFELTGAILLLVACLTYYWSRNTEEAEEPVSRPEREDAEGRLLPTTSGSG